MPSQLPLRTTSLANRPGFGGEDPFEHTLGRAKESERLGFDLTSVSDWVVGDPFPPLILAAQQTTTLGLMTRISCPYNRSPILTASAAGWLDRISGGRFVLGLGPSLRFEAQGMHGEPFDHPAPRMADIITIIRGLWGEDLPGIERHANGTLSYEGKVVSVQQTSVDVRPERRVPILLAAAGPHMLRVAGALCDGVILERASLRYLDWAREQLEIGAARTARSLDGFEICLQGSFLIDRPGEVESRSVQAAIGSHIDYCQYPEWDATHEVMGLGDAVRAVRAALERGETQRARDIVEERFLPEIGVPLGAARMEEFFGWTQAVRRRGVTILPLPLEIEDLTGWTAPAIKERILELEGARA